MPGGKKPITTPAMDETIKAVYPEQGGPATVKAVNEKHGTQFKLKQIHSRANVLRLSAPQSQGGTPDPSYLENIQSCEPVGIYKILGYCGFKKKDALFKGHHWYQVKCTVCGAERRLMQESIYQSNLKGHKNCIKCVRSNVLSDAEQRAIAREREKKAMREWVSTMKLMPPVSLDLVPFEKRFDSQRLIC